MKNYILLLGVAGVALGSYAAYAGNSATMTVTARIEHDVQLGGVTDINMGTIYINPAYDGSTEWDYSDSGEVNLFSPGAAVSVPNATAGTFTANIPNPSACNTSDSQCGGLTVEGTDDMYIHNLFGGSDYQNNCAFHLKYNGTGNSFKVFPVGCAIFDVSSAIPGEHSGTLTIRYSAGG
ncbi:MAG: hypothetical protein IJ689_01590 [Alphaproteobacteria bacterium]|nr:hypothetical protein [Alphaproteobacteria bacterium]